MSYFTGRVQLRLELLFLPMFVRDSEPKAFIQIQQIEAVFMCCQYGMKGL